MMMMMMMMMMTTTIMTIMMTTTCVVDPLCLPRDPVYRVHYIQTSLEQTPPSEVPTRQKICHTLANNSLGECSSPGRTAFTFYGKGKASLWHEKKEALRRILEQIWSAANTPGTCRSWFMKSAEGSI